MTFQFHSDGNAAVEVSRNRKLRLPLLSINAIAECIRRSIKLSRLRVSSFMVFRCAAMATNEIETAHSL